MIVSSTLKAMLPSVLHPPLRRLRSAILPSVRHQHLRRLHPSRDYEALYDTMARELPPTHCIGCVEDGDFERVGRAELALLLNAGLKPGDTLVDFGCGTGRLAVHVIPWLADDGRYVGIDISKTMLAHARVMVDERVSSHRCSFEFLHQTTPDFPMPDQSVDMICAFSVFTHMEHEDSYRYLRSTRRIVKEGGKLIYSCLPMEELAFARQTFEQEASVDAVERWSRVRNVTTSRDLMDTIARMAGWEPMLWNSGHPEQPGAQSSCVLVAA